MGGRPAWRKSLRAPSPWDWAATLLRSQSAITSNSEYRRERQEIEEIPDEERREVAEVFRSYGLAGADLERVVTSLSAEPARWADFMMRFELGLERPAAGRAPQSALTIGLSYFLAGLVPLLPYMFMASLRDAFAVSIGVTLATLLVFGGIKGKLAGVSPVRAALQTMAVGGVAAAIAFRGRTNGQLVTIVGPLDVLRPLVVG